MLRDLPYNQALFMEQLDVIERTKLGPKEIQVLCGVTSGRLRKEVADEMGICIKTVDRHIEGLHTKLRITNNVDLTHFAIGYGFIKVKQFKL